jgi:hypothetical protein
LNVFVWVGGVISLPAAEAGQTDPCLEIKTLNKIDGFLPIYKDEPGGKIYIEIPEDGGPDLLFESILTSGVGSRDITNSGADALDRGKFGNSGLVSFRHFGPHVLLIQRNTNYYTPDSDLGSPQDAGWSFPNAVLSSMEIACHTDKTLIINATDFFLHDWIDVPGVMKTANQGSYSFDQNHSVLDLARAHTTAESVEVDSLLNFKSNDTLSDNIIGRLAADSKSILLHERTALVRLPDLKTSDFKPRYFDPRSGFFDNTYYDPELLPYVPMRRSVILRFSLKKKNPDEKVSEPTSPIIFYIDPTVPADLHPLIVDAVLQRSKKQALGMRYRLETSP